MFDRLEDWQNKAKSLSEKEEEKEEMIKTKINFLDDKDEIQNAFSEICKPLEGLYQIEFNKKDSSITICNTIYKLDIKEHVISILYGKVYPSRFHQKFVVSENDIGEKSFHYETIRNVEDEYYLFKIHLCYKDILNELMNRAIKNKR